MDSDAYEDHGGKEGGGAVRNRKYEPQIGGDEAALLAEVRLALRGLDRMAVEGRTSREYALKVVEHLRNSGWQITPPERNGQFDAVEGFETI